MATIYPKKMHKMNNKGQLVRLRKEVKQKLDYVQLLICCKKNRIITKGVALNIVLDQFIKDYLAQAESTDKPAT